MYTTAARLVVPSTIADHLAFLTGTAIRGTRKVGNTLRIKFGFRTATPSTTPQTAAAMEAIVKAGHRVRRFEDDSIFEATVIDGTLVWEQSKARMVRAGAVVEVTL